MSQTDIQYNLILNTEIGYSELRKLEITVYRLLSLMEKMGLPPEAAKFINEVQRMIMVIRSLQMAIRALEAASGPLGWAYALISLATTSAVASDFMLSIGE